MRLTSLVLMKGKLYLGCDGCGKEKTKRTTIPPTIQAKNNPHGSSVRGAM